MNRPNRLVVDKTIFPGLCFSLNRIKLRDGAEGLPAEREGRVELVERPGTQYT